MIEQKSDNLILSDEQIENAALYLIAWNCWGPREIESAKDRIRSLLHNSPEARGIAVGALAGKKR